MVHLQSRKPQEQIFMSNQETNLPPKKQPTFNNLQKQEIKKQVEEMVKLGYQSDHLVINPDGTVVFDPEAVDRDAFIQAVKKDEEGQTN